MEQKDRTVWELNNGDGSIENKFNDVQLGSIIEFIRFDDNNIILTIVQ